MKDKEPEESQKSKEAKIGNSEVKSRGLRERSPGFSFKSLKETLLPLLLLVFLGSLLLILKYLPQRTHLPPKAQSSSPPPQRVKISNLNPKSFTVSWTTTEAARGGIIYGESKEMVEKGETLSPRKDDERGVTYQSLVHSVRVENLNSGSKYYFKIISGEKVFYKGLEGEWSEAGVVEVVELPNSFSFNSSATLGPNNTPGSFSLETTAFGSCPKVPEGVASSCFRPNPVFGQVLGQNQTPAGECLVYLEIPAKSNLISTLTDKEGKWVVNLANLLNKDQAGYLGYLPGVDLVKVTAHGPQNSTAITYRPIPPVTKTYQDATNPTTLTLIFPPQTPTPQPSAPPAPTNTPIPPIGTLSVSLTLKGRDSGSLYGNFDFYQGTTKSFSRRVRLSGSPHEGTISLYRTGSFNLRAKPDGYLAQMEEIEIERGSNSFDFEEDFLGGDLNSDNKIDVLDVSLILDQINKKTKSLSGDFNGDGKVDSLDLAILTGNYQKEGK
jgi:hypothetical protein